MFDIEVDGKLLDKRGDDRDNQATLEESILKVNYKSFTQIVILGSSTFVPFMQLPAAHRREVIEDLLDIRVFSTMNGVIRDKMRAIREDLKILELKKSSLKDKVSMQQNFIDEITKRGESKIVEKQEESKNMLFEQCGLEQKVIIELNSIEELQKQLENIPVCC